MFRQRVREQPKIIHKDDQVCLLMNPTIGLRKISIGPLTSFIDLEDQS
jgi:hypothetical protein